MKRVYLCQPYCGQIEPEAMEARLCCDEGRDDLQVDRPRISSSALVHNFNLGVATCKNGGVGDRKRPYDYFAMIHSDMAAEPGWLGVLIDEMDKHDLDMIHAVAPLKDARGMSSTAMAYSMEPYGRKRKLSIREAFSLPETFTLADVKEKIDPDAQVFLPNPGCMVMRVGKWFYDWPGFETWSKVDKHEGQYRSHFVSEDYVFGYYAAEHNLKLGATTRVRTHHFGRCDYSTVTAWGMETDREYFQLLGKPPVGPGRWIFPGEIEGWLSQTEGVMLAKLAKGKRVLEIGSYLGRSTICMGQTAAEIVSVDPRDGRATSNEKPTLGEFLNNIAKYQIENVKVQVCTSEAYAESWDGEKFDLVFIDGDHSHAAVKHDIDLALRVLADGGLIAFHDYRDYAGQHDGRWDGEVKQAVDEFLASGAELVERAGTVAVVRPVMECV